LGISSLRNFFEFFLGGEALSIKVMQISFKRTVTLDGGITSLCLILFERKLLITSCILV